MTQQFSSPSMQRAAARESGALRDYENTGINDPRNAVYLTKGGRIFRAWGCERGRTELVNCNTGHVMSYADEEVRAMVAEGSLMEIEVPVGGLRVLGVEGDETLEVPKMATRLTGKYRKGGVVKSSAPEPPEMLPVVEIDGPPLNSPAARLLGKYKKRQ